MALSVLFRFSSVAPVRIYKFMKYGGSDPKQKGKANALVHFIADTMSPLSVVENSHLKTF